METLDGDATVTRFWIGAGAGYLVLLAALVGSLLLARQNALRSFASPDARQAWQDWRATTEQQQGEELPVQRSVPRSAEPPTLVLLRDHFQVCLVTGLTLSSVLYWTVAFFVRGMTSGPRFEVQLRTDRPHR
jgi:hypothetical protein